jgi:hypothetical protein
MIFLFFSMSTGSFAKISKVLGTGTNAVIVGSTVKSAKGLRGRSSDRDTGDPGGDLVMLI